MSQNYEKFIPQGELNSESTPAQNLPLHVTTGNFKR
jgi:hypothetical protein